MNLYLVNLVFRIENKHEAVAQFDEQLRLIKATSTSNAYEKAMLLALDEEGPVKHIEGKTIQWKFVGITSLLEMENMNDQSEIFSNTRETALPQAYVQYVKEKQKELLYSINQYSNGQVSVC